ncbi:MAG: nicotinate phosphoribosyltransferase [Gammaproteobacteria bacterium]
MSDTPARGDALLTDLYQLTMLAAYYERGMTGEAVFEFFVRRLPATRNFLLTAGLAQLVEYLESLRFGEAELAWLSTIGRFNADFLERLGRFRFTGDLDALPEGTVCFANEPIARITAPLPEAQFIESRLINLLHFQTVIASKAARLVLAAPDRMLADFGFRRAHGAEAGVLAARAAYLAGFEGTATVEAGRRFGIPVLGTMAHSFVLAHASEADAFRHFLECYPDNTTLLIDTFDTVAGARKVVELAAVLRASGIRIDAVRIDSGGIGELSRAVRRILDDGGCRDTRIFASGGLDEAAIAALVDSGAPIDGYGVGTTLDASVDEPVFDCAYKLQEFAGRPVRKLSPGKETWPGRKQVERHFDRDGRLLRDDVVLESDAIRGQRLLVPVMRRGRRIEPLPALRDCRARAQRELAALPLALRSITRQAQYEVRMAASVRELAGNSSRG